VLIQYGVGAYRRDNGNLPELKLVNLFLEKSPTSEQQATLQSRKGLETSSSPGTGPIQGIYAQEGSFGGDKFTVSGGSLYRGTTLLGSIAGTGPVSWACSGSELLVTRGTTLYSYNGTNLAAVTFPDSANVTAVTFLAGLFVAVRANSQKFYWSAVLDGRTWDALDFASAESAPDSLRDALTVRGNLYLLGQDTIECWYPSGALDLPFSRVDQRLYEKGVISTGCAAEWDNALAWVGNDGIVYRSGDVPERLSDHGIEERIGASATVSCFQYSYEGHKFFAVRLDTGTFLIDAASGQWCEFASYGRANFRASCAVNLGESPYFGDDELGRVWTFGDTFQDNGSALEAYFSAGFHTTTAVMVDALEVVANVGWTNPLAGDDASPVIEMRQSRDAGATFGNWRQASLGAQGNYRTRARYRRLGMFDSPGALFEFRTTDQSPRRISGVYINEPAGGRGR
jgi:hypothetical protein